MKYVKITLPVLLLPVILFAQPSITIAIQPFEKFHQRYIEKIKTGIDSIYGKVTIIVLPEKKLLEIALPLSKAKQQ